MRFVYAHGDERDRTEGHYNCRTWLEEDLKGFMTKLAQMESQESAAALAVKAGGCPECCQPG
jgi:hypothetical protein